ATSGHCPLSLHDALPICRSGQRTRRGSAGRRMRRAATAAVLTPSSKPSWYGLEDPERATDAARYLVAALTVSRRDSSAAVRRARSEEHTSELQSRENLVC